MRMAAESVHATGSATRICSSAKPTCSSCSSAKMRASRDCCLTSGEALSGLRSSAHRQALALAQSCLCDLLYGSGINGPQSSAFCIDLLLAQDNRGPANEYNSR